MIKSVFYVAIGSMIGGVARFLMQRAVQARFFSSFPYGTLSVNILGCFIIGVVYALSEKGNVLSPQARLFLATGVCGGFTTFSSFIYENYSLIQEGEVLHTVTYIFASVLVGLLATFLGIFVIKIL